MSVTGALSRIFASLAPRTLPTPSSPDRGFKFKKNGTAKAGQLMANVAEKCRRKGLHGWIQKSTMSIEGECWGLQDKGKKEEAYKQTRKWFRNQNECVWACQKFAGSYYYYHYYFGGEGCPFGAICPPRCTAVMHHSTPSRQ